MRLLLDTQIFIWFINADERLPSRFGELIRDGANQVFLSVVSVWEATVKHQLGKLRIAEPPETFFPIARERHRISSLALVEADVQILRELPSVHCDPFDRMLICQALHHSLTLITVDDVVRQYPVPTFPI